MSFKDYNLYRKTDPIYTYKLMLKCHFETGISYLCVTKRPDWQKYLGSGVLWLKLIKKRKSKIITTLLFTSDDKDVFNDACLFYSKLLDVVNNKDFANLIIESGFKQDLNKKYTIKSIDKDTKIDICRKGGMTTKNKKVGIFAEEHQAQRKTWAKNAAEALNKTENRSGIYCKKWRENNSEITKKICSKGGKIGGKITGKMLWWNNGIINKKSFVCPGEEWNRGMIMSEKKKAQIYSKFAGNNRKVKTNDQ